MSVDQFCLWDGEWWAESLTSLIQADMSAVSKPVLKVSSSNSSTVSVSQNPLFISVTRMSATPPEPAKISQGVEFRIPLYIRYRWTLQYGFRTLTGYPKATLCFCEWKYWPGGSLVLHAPVSTTLESQSFQSLARDIYWCKMCHTHIDNKKTGILEAHTHIETCSPPYPVRCWEM